MIDLQKLALQMTHRREVAIEVFGPERAKEIELVAHQEVYTKSEIGLLNAFEVCLQIEAEFNGRLEEIVRRAWKLHYDTEGVAGNLTQCLIMVIMTERSKHD